MSLAQYIPPKDGYMLRKYMRPIIHWHVILKMLHCVGQLNLVS